MSAKAKITGIMVAMAMVSAPFGSVSAATPAQSPLPKFDAASTELYLVAGPTADPIVNWSSPLAKNMNLLDVMNKLSLERLNAEPKSLVFNKQILAKDGVSSRKYYINVYETPVIKVNSSYYSISKNNSEILKSATTGGISRPLWLVHMNPNRITRMSHCSNASDKEAAYLQATAQNIAGILSRINTKTSGTYEKGKIVLSPSDKQVRMKIQFDSGVVYTLWFLADSRELYLESSDMTQGCQYTLDVSDELAMVLSKISCEFDTWLTPAPGEDKGNPMTGKPVIYLYPEKEQGVSVKLGFKGKLYYTFPTYHDGWNVTAQPDGTLTNKSDQSTHYYLFWDGTADKKVWSFDSGFVVKSSELESFFKDTLPKMGLTPKEYNDFITYWVPKLSANEYTLITFATDEYTEIAPLDITPKPDTVLRVHMVYKPVDAPVEIAPQVLPEAPEREGFTVVEWGGTLSE